MTAGKLVNELANKLLTFELDPIPRFRLLRDLLEVPKESSELQQAHEAIFQSRWMKELQNEQRTDGSWGRFHSVDSSAKWKIPKTEFGVRRGIVLGLAVDDVIFQKCISYLKGLLEDNIPWPADEGEERNDRWPTGKQMFTASTLALIQPDHPILDDIWQMWTGITRRTFITGNYDPDAEWRAHCELSGAASMRGSYLRLNNRYAIEHIGSRAKQLDEKTERSYFCWLWESPIIYLGWASGKSPKTWPRKFLLYWFAQQEMLSFYPSWYSLFQRTADVLWQMRNTNELWDFGSETKSARAWHLSESWRKKTSRMIDHTTRVLLLLAKYYRGTK